MRRLLHWFTGHLWMRFEFSGATMDEDGDITRPVLSSIVLFCDCGAVLSHAVSQKLASDEEVAELRKIAGLPSSTEPTTTAAAIQQSKTSSTARIQTKKD
jgi:hypothetical protein